MPISNKNLTNENPTGVTPIAFDYNFGTNKVKPLVCPNFV